MRTHHNLAEVAGRYKDTDLMPIARVLCPGITDEDTYRTAHYDPIILGFILGRTWPDCQDEVLAAIAADLDYDKMIARVTKAPVKVKGIDLGKLEFKL